MNANDVVVGADVLIGQYTWKWSYVPAKVVRITKTWIIVKRLHDGAPEETFKKNNLRELNAGVSRGSDLIIDPIKMQEALGRQERDNNRRTLENEAAAVLNKLQQNIRGQSDDILKRLISIHSEQA